MKKWVKRSLLLVALLLAVVAALSAVGVSMFHGTPAWYGGPRASAADRERYAHAAENKLISAQNWAQEIVADNQRARRAAAATAASAVTTAPAAQPAGAAAAAAGAATAPAARAESLHEITFTQDELNALFDKWSTLYGWQEKYAGYLEDPQVVLTDGRLILAGKLTQIGAVASFQFRPSIDVSGQLRLELVRVTAGRLPMPDAVWTKYRDQIIAQLKQNLPQWQARAKIDPRGAADFAAMAATFSRLLFAVAHHRPADPILFLPLAGGGEGDSVPVRVAAAGVDEGKLTLKVAPLTPGERTALLARIKSAEPPAGDAQASGR